MENLEKNAFGIPPGVQVVSDSGLMQVFHKRASDDFWKSVNCIQTNIRAKIGCGFPIIVKFYSPVSHSDPSSEIHFDFQQFGDDRELIRTDLSKYCIK